MQTQTHTCEIQPGECVCFPCFYLVWNYLFPVLLDVVIPLSVGFFLEVFSVGLGLWIDIV